MGKEASNENVQGFRWIQYQRKGDFCGGSGNPLGTGVAQYDSNYLHCLQPDRGALPCSPAPESDRRANSRAHELGNEAVKAFSIPYK
jgi:hypothetical protein